MIYGHGRVCVCVCVCTRVYLCVSEKTSKCIFLSHTATEYFDLEWNLMVLIVYNGALQGISSRHLLFFFYLRLQMRCLAAHSCPTSKHLSKCIIHFEGLQGDISLKPAGLQTKQHPNIKQRLKIQPRLKLFISLEIVLVFSS